MQRARKQIGIVWVSFCGEQTFFAGMSRAGYWLGVGGAVQGLVGFCWIHRCNVGLDQVSRAIRRHWVYRY